MHETAEDLRQLQQLLDRSYAHAGEHLRSVFTPERRMSAEQLVQHLRGIFVLNVATVSAHCEPLVAPVDGLFYRGRLLFGFPAGAVRADHVRARPQVSAVYQRDEAYCVIAHGHAREVDLSAPDEREYRDFFREAYGPEWDLWRDRHRDRRGEFNGWIEARRLFALQPAPHA